MGFYYRIFDDKDGCPATLFHGINGSRILPLDIWVDANVKPVTDGSAVTVYDSGFHVLKQLKKVKEVLRSGFKYLDYRVICRVEIDENSGVWPKSHSKNPVILAKRMKIHKSDWDNRIYGKDLWKIDL